LRCSLGLISLTNSELKCLYLRIVYFQFKYGMPHALLITLGEKEKRRIWRWA
jgi:hypothetical protein